MKVLFASGYNPFYAGSGPGGCLHYLSKTLATIGCEVHILTPKIVSEGDLGYGVTIHHYNNPLDNTSLDESWIPFSLFSIKQIKQLCKEYKIDIVHGHSPTTFVFSIMRDKKIPFVVSAHGTSFGEIDSLYKTPAKLLNLASFQDAIIFQPSWAWLTNLEYKNADRVIAVSKAVAYELASYYRIDRRKISVVHNGVYVPPIKCQVEDQLILSIGRMVWRKGFLYLIDAMPTVLKEFPNARLILVGEGVYKQKLIEHTKRLKLEHAVIFCGYLPKQELYNLYAKAQVYIQPSLYEPLCGTILEAMAFQKPVIATRLGGNLELIQHKKNGILVDSYDSNQLAESINQLLSDTFYCKRLGKNAKETIEKFFSWESIAYKTLNVYKNLVKEQ